MSRHRNRERAERDTEEVSQGYEGARLAYELAEWARKRREDPGLSQAAVAARAGMTRPALPVLEAGGTLPTVPLLRRLAQALDAEFDLGRSR
ncbi:helix-turn-helix protein [Actinocorallia herbida]|uniref:Helix-turn-helix protein n=1 Tax=Actinocorallia herbida TaxID=58109 RepID=A0A3N1D1J5_9ACTN|nr:helix-turn-helix transcriptional regulator [Actinocorallia herbida]ROO87386.1 helix-turn-helix protein [Actinocorallia herbida]